MKQRLDLKQGQSLAMTPQMQQAIKLLQMSNIELNAFVEAELEKNPLLERDETPAGADTAPAQDTTTTGNDIDRALGPRTADDTETAYTQQGRALDTDFENVFTGGGVGENNMAAVDGGYDAFATNSFAGTGRGGSAGFDDPDYAFENNMAQEPSLREHLTAQIQLECPDVKTRAIATLMLDYLDEAGYMRADTDTLAQRLGCEKTLVESVLDKLHALDPPGIFARDLRECLALQLREKNRLDPAMSTLLDNLDILARQDMKTLCTLCGVDAEDLRDMVTEIRALNPKPALAFDHFVAQTVVPDVLMRPLPKSRGGGWAVELNTDTLPRVLVNQTYYTEISKSATGKADKEYLGTQMNTANWLVRAMDQRAQTILKVATDIIEKQEAFFNYGVAWLKPLVLREVAEAIGMHESTVSRVTSGKYIGTPRGVFELKYFFSSGVSSTDGAAAFAAEAVKARIKTLIDAETAQSVLSDDDIVKALTAEGIDIARRTVAKYREAMKIASSVQRRRALKNTGG